MRYWWSGAKSDLPPRNQADITIAKRNANGARNPFYESMRGGAWRPNLLVHGHADTGCQSFSRTHES
jgi:hypothetical protein